MTILLSLMQSEKQVRLERLSRVFPCLITAESRRRKLQRFLDLPNLLWFRLNKDENGGFKKNQSHRVGRE
jgi:hypothetical protein